MSFIDIKDPKKRDQIVADYVATIRNIQQRNENEKTLGQFQQQQLEKTFEPIIKAGEKSTEQIIKKIEPLQNELETVTTKINANTRLPIIIGRKRTWDERSGQNAIDYYLKNYSKTDLDKYYSIKQEDGGLMLGNKQVLVDSSSNITIDDTTYKGTTGLWQLIMLNSPNESSYTKEDEQDYKEIINQTNLMNHPRDVKMNSRPRTTVKRRIMDRLLRNEGEGIYFLPGDIKSLSSKLKLLLAEFRAGNTSTRNEIVFILDELLRRKRISRKEYVEINTLLS